MTAAALRHARYVVTENPITLIAFSMLLMLLLLALLGPALAPYDPLKSDTANTLKPPSVRHWFGTDQLGRDMLSRVMVATRLDMAIAFSAVALYFAVGESTLAEHLDVTVARFPGVGIGSYPRFDAADHRVKVTFDGRDQTEVRAACEFLKRRLPPEAIVREE